jgi:endonuclease/exonuclease/phosphatase (EEP) superfamily protein YafD
MSPFIWCTWRSAQNPPSATQCPVQDGQKHRVALALYKMVRNTELPCLVAGDFNMLSGEKEIEIFLAATGLRNANHSRLPTYPSRNPHRHLDFVLYSKGIQVKNFEVPDVQYSDHLPILIDFDVDVPIECRNETRPAANCSCLERMERMFAA